MAVDRGGGRLPPSDRGERIEATAGNCNRFIELGWVSKKGVYVLVAEPVDLPDFQIELIESDTGGSGGRSAPGLYGSGGRICDLRSWDAGAFCSGRCLFRSRRVFSTAAPRIFGR